MDLVRALQDRGTARLEVTRDRPVRLCRKLLIEAAVEADVRIEMKREVESDPPFEQVVARVLSPAEAEVQIQRDAIFRAVNRIRTGVEVLQTVDTSDILDEVLDLTDIADELEQYARQISGGGKGVSPFTPQAAPAP